MPEAPRPISSPASAEVSAAAARPRRYRGASRPLYSSFYLFLFTVIPIGFILAVMLLPALDGVVLSFEHNGASLANYRAVLADPLFWRAFGNNLLIPGASLALELAVGLGLAMVLSAGKGKFSAAAEVTAIVPFALPEIVLLAMARYIFMPRGYLDGALREVGIGSLPWLIPGSPLSLLTVIVVDAWHITPVVMLIFIAGLQAIPGELYEAAYMDGAGPLATFWYVTLPMLTPSIIAAVVLRGVDALRIFSTTLVLTGAEGVPVLSTYAYQLWTDEQEPRMAMAASVILAVLIVAISLVWFVVMRHRAQLEGAR